MGLLSRFARRPIPAALRPLLAADEQLLAIAEVEGGMLAVTRYGIWHLPSARADTDTDTDVGAHGPERIGWETVSKAHWDGHRLGLTIADVRGELGGAQWLQDRPRLVFAVVQAGKVTDIVHTRTRAGVVAAEHQVLPGGGGWLVLRRVPGRDGLTPQIRLDPGTDPSTPGLADAVADLVRRAMPVGGTDL